MSELMFVLKTFFASVALFAVLQWTYDGKPLEHHVEDLVFYNAPAVELKTVAEGVRLSTRRGWLWVQTQVNQMTGQAQEVMPAQQDKAGK